MHKTVIPSSFSLLNTDYVQLDKTWHYSNILSPFYRLYLIDGGRGRLFNRASAEILEPGWLYLIPAFTVCNYQCADWLSQYYCHFTDDAANGSEVLFAGRIGRVKAARGDLQLFKRLVQLNPGRGLRVSADPKVYEKQPVIRGFRELNNSMPPAVFLETKGILLQLLARFLAAGTFAINQPADYPPKIAAATGFIQANLQAPITVTQLAAKAGQHPDYFSRNFQQHTGYRPLAYVQFRRIQQAQMLTLATTLPFSAIAVQTGFDTLAYFSRVFKNITGMSPSEYRRRKHAP